MFTHSINCQGNPHSHKGHVQTGNVVSNNMKHSHRHGKIENGIKGTYIYRYSSEFKPYSGEKQQEKKVESVESDTTTKLKGEFQTTQKMETSKIPIKYKDWFA